MKRRRHTKLTPELAAAIAEHFALVPPIPRIAAVQSAPPVANRPTKSRSADPVFATWSDRQKAEVSRMRCHCCPAGWAHIEISAGLKSDGTLRIERFCSPSCATTAGFGWAGR